MVKNFYNVIDRITAPISPVDSQPGSYRTGEVTNWEVCKGERYTEALSEAALREGRSIEWVTERFKSGHSVYVVENGQQITFKQRTEWV